MQIAVFARSGFCPDIKHESFSLGFDARATAARCVLVDDSIYGCRCYIQLDNNILYVHLPRHLTSIVVTKIITDAVTAVITRGMIVDEKIIAVMHPSFDDHSILKL